MRMRFVTATILALFTVSLRANPGQVQTPRGDKPQPTACHGTAVEFVDTPVEAAKLAAQQKKLVLVLHVSGHFEDPGFT